MAFSGDTKEAFDAILQVARTEGCCIWGFILDGDAIQQFSNSGSNWDEVRRDTLTALEALGESNQEEPSIQHTQEGEKKWN